MQEVTLENEVCIASFDRGILTSVDFISLEDLQEQQIILPAGVYATAFMTPLMEH